MANVEITQKCLRIVDTCMNFIRTTGGDPNQTLLEYATQVLLLENTLLKDVWRSSVFSQLRLRHIVALWQVESFFLYF